MSKTSVDVLILSTVEGHYSIACAISDALETAGLSCQIAVCPDQILSVYRFFSRYRPSLLKVFFDLLHVALFRRTVAWYLRRNYSRTLFDLPERHSPRILISTNYAFEPSITRYRRGIPIPYVNIVTDPRTYFLPNISPVADVNCVFDDRIDEACARQYPRAHTRVTGWFVRSQFSPPADRARVRESLSLDASLFTILIAAGSEGTNQVLKILPGLTDARSPVQVVVACGNNTRMHGLVSTLADSAREASSDVRIVALPFTQEIHLYMQAADLLVGKAGPNMLFESVATGTPFLAITHSHGQEDGNLEIIRDYQLGYVEENPWRARKLLRTIIEEPGMLTQFLVPIERLARRNRAASEEIRNVVEKLLAHPPGRTTEAPVSGRAPRPDGPRPAMPPGDRRPERTGPR
jgi:UDP-N-acetylglucosamine:LPS N-acetylglucosamine transferase